MESGMSLSAAESLFLNRELSLLKFNERVLVMAETLAIPLLERLRCVCIVSSNLDEFFEIRVSSLKQQLLQNPGLISLDGLTPGEAFQHVQEAAHKLVARQYALLNEEILPQLRAEGIGLHFVSDWDAQQQ